MAQQDPYAVLGVARSAGADEIKSAYRKLARRYHPDVNPGDSSAEEKFKEIGQAYSVLSDPDKRARFDRTGSMDDQPGADFFQGGQSGGFGDLFDMFFGQTQAGGTARRGRDGEDLRADIDLTLLDVLNGASRDIEVQRQAECNSCHGMGTDGGKAPDPCGTCKGQGVVGTVRNTFLGQVRTTTTCPTCQGAGVVIKVACKVCHGRGVTQQKQKVSLSIPPGFDDGATMHLPSQGHDGAQGGRPGDLYVVLHVKNDDRFERQGQTLFTRLELTFAQACLGDSFEIQGVEGAIPVEVGAGTQPNQRITIKAAGLPPLHGGRRGDLVAVATIKIPTKLTEAEVKVVREFAELRGETQPKGEEKGGILGGIFGKKR